MLKMVSDEVRLFLWIKKQDRSIFSVLVAKDDGKTTGKQNIDLTDGKESRLTSTQSTNKKKDHVKTSKKRSKKTSSTCESESVINSSGNYCTQLENKLKWAVDEVMTLDRRKIVVIVFLLSIVNKIAKSQSYQCDVYSDH